MMLSVYVTLGVFVLLAVRNPSANRQPNRLHRMVEHCSCSGDGDTSTRKMSPRGDLGGVLFFLVIGVILAALAPTKQSAERASGVSV